MEDAFMRSLSFLVAFGLLFVVSCGSPQELARVTVQPASAPLITEDVTTSEVDETRDNPTVVPTSGVSVGRFDQGKMWTFDQAPTDYFEEAYGFRPDSSWYERARLGSLRFSTFCSASFVSPNGLIMTNHHCARESIEEVSNPGENLLTKGFYADSIANERKVDELYVEQLIEIRDVSKRVLDASKVVRGDEDKARVLRQKSTQIEEQMTRELQAKDSTLHVQVVDLYNGARYAAYTFKKYEDIRLVLAPELQLGFFGGDADNFTYPRYNLDMSFFRAYDDSGKPLTTDSFFRWSDAGSRPGDAVFVVGNPGTTSRLNTVSELLYEREYTLPQQTAALEKRAAILKEYLDALPEDEPNDELQNAYFDLGNTIKATRGQLAGLHDADLIARRQAFEDTFKRDLAANDSLSQLYGDVLQSIDELQRFKEAIARRQAAFTFFGTPLSSRVLTRTLYGYYYDLMKRRGFPPSDLEEVRKEAMELEDLPVEVEKDLIAIRFQEVLDALGDSDPTIRRALDGMTVDSAATLIVQNTALVDTTGFSRLLDEGYLSSDDVSVKVIEALGPLYLQFSEQQQDFDTREELLNAELSLARFSLYGSTIPPDASFSPRITDGVVKGYSYNGTTAPAFTTFFGLYNKHFSHKGKKDWALPDRWLDAPDSFDHATPMNLVTTNDITGGNSGSPLLNKDLEIVGLVFDGNMESLPNHYLFSDDTARTVSVDSRGMLEAIDHVYDADRLALELSTGTLAQTEAEADALRGSQ